MENRARLRVRNKKALKRGKKHFLKRVVDYLKCDTFMYAPLLSPLPFDFRSPDTLPSSAKVVELKKPIIENKPFLDQVGEYMKSDVYMYAPMFGPPHSTQESLQYYGMIRMAVSTRRLSVNVNQSTDHIGNVNQKSENRLPQTGLSDQHTQSHRETMKHTMYQSCYCASASGKVTLNSQLRAVN